MHRKPISGKDSEILCVYSDFSGWFAVRLFCQNFQYSLRTHIFDFPELHQAFVGKFLISFYGGRKSSTPSSIYNNGGRKCGFNFTEAVIEERKGDLNAVRVHFTGNWSLIGVISPPILILLGLVGSKPLLQLIGNSNCVSITRAGSLLHITQINSEWLAFVSKIELPIAILTHSNF